MLNVVSAMCNLFLFLILNKMRGSRKAVAIYTGGIWLLCSAAFLWAIGHGYGNVPASFVCYTAPSFILLLFASKYRGFRFIFNFCMADVLNLLISTVASILAGIVNLQPFTVVIYVALMAGILYMIWRIRPKYLEMQQRFVKGWGLLAFNSILFYISLYVSLGYPTDITNREEYFPVLLLQLVLASLFFFVVYTLFSAKIDTQTLEKTAYTDALTGLGNRAAFMQDVSEISANIEKYAPVICVSMDLNNLKAVNDAYGHAAGDKYIVAAADVIRHVFNADERKYRIGGDEFCVFICNAEPYESADIAAKINAAAKKHSQRADMCLSIAAAAAVTTNTASNSLSAAFKQADKLMYEQKIMMKNAQ